MRTIGIETAQNVRLDHETASIGDRVVAYIIDSLIIYSWLILWIIVLSEFDGMNSDIYFTIGFAIALFPVLFYHLICEVTMNGQSIGKRTRNIKVARMDGGQPRLGQYLLRWVLKPIDSFYWIGLVVILINGRGQRLGDLAAGTTVISLKPRMRSKDTLLTEIPEEYAVRFQEAIKLTDAQAAMIREVLNNRTGDKWAMIDEMAEKVKNVIGASANGMRSLEFLQTVLRDHVYLTSRSGEATSTSR